MAEPWNAYADYRATHEHGEPRAIKCKSCGAWMWYGLTRAGKKCPFNINLGGYTGSEFYTSESHFSTCPQAREHSRRMAQPQKDAH